MNDALASKTGKVFSLCLFTWTEAWHQIGRDDGGLPLNTLITGLVMTLGTPSNYWCFVNVYIYYGNMEVADASTCDYLFDDFQG